MNVLGFLRLLIKVPLFMLMLFCYFLASSFVFVIVGFSFDRARPYLTKIISVASSVGLNIIGVKVRRDLRDVDFDENFLIVSNHLSYLDVLVISRFFPSCFITSMEMKKTPFLGQICLLGGCLFVDRKNRNNLTAEVEELTNALSNGLNVAIFPEATSTNGSSVIRFRRPLFQAAINSHSKVLPVCLNYRSVDDEVFTLKNRDLVFWYDDMTFAGHAIKLFACRRVVVELTVLPSFPAKDFPDKSDLAEKCHQLISDQYTKIN